MTMKRVLAYISLFAFFGCANATSTRTAMEGRVVFTESAPVVSGTQIVVQVSENGFSSILATDRVNNEQGFITVPFRIEQFTISSAQPFLQVRAFQDNNGNGSWDSGEPCGRYDGTADGNGSYLLIQTDQEAQDGGDLSSDEFLIQGLSLTFDSTTGQ